MLLRLFLCLLTAGVAFYAYIAQNNVLTELRMEIPKLAKEVRTLQENNGRLDLEIRRYRSPEHLLKLSKDPAYSHLHYPTDKEVVYQRTPD